MKWLKRIVLIVVLLLVVALASVYMVRNRIVRRTVEVQATDSLKLTTTLDSAHLSLFGGSLKLSGLGIASPQGFSAPHMFSLDDASVLVQYGQLRQDPIHIQRLDIVGPKVVVERNGDQVNLKTVTDQLAQGRTGDQTPAAPSGKQLRLVVDTIQMKGAVVLIRPGQIPGLSAMPREIPVTLPDITLTNVGAEDNGAAIKQVVAQILTVMVAKAQESDQLPQQLRQMLNASAQDLASHLSQKFNQQLGQITHQLGVALPPELGGVFGNVANPATQELDRSIERKLGDLMDRNTNKKKPHPSTNGS